MNPEFRRNIWLEMTPLRVIVMPAVLGLIFFLAYLTGRGLERPFEPIAVAAHTIFFVISFIWGTKLASEAMQDEISEHTWDFQRMSPISAWTMTWGKLFGSTVYIWYGSAICFAAYFLASIVEYDLSQVLIVSSLMLGSAVLAQTIAFIFSLDMILKTRNTGRSVTFGAFIVAFPIGTAFFAVARTFKHVHPPDIIWYGMSIDFFYFNIISLYIAIAWCLLGAYRLMRVELQYQCTPWAWFAFLLYQMIYFSGFIPNDLKKIEIGSTALCFFIAFLIALGWAYLLAIVESKNIVRFRKLALAVSSRNLIKALTLVPKWLVSYLMAVVAGVLTFLVSPAAEMGVYRIGINSFVLASLLFAIRDICVFLLLSFSKLPGKRADSFAILYLGIVYILLPLIFAALRISDLQIFLHQFNNADNFFVAIVPPLIEAALMSYLVFSSWQTKSKVD